MQDCMFIWWPGKSCYSLDGKFWFIHWNPQTLHLQVATYFGVYKILLMEEISIPWKTVKGTWNSSLLKKIKFWEDGIFKWKWHEKWQKVLGQNYECLHACQVTSVMSNSLRPHGLQPTSLLYPWNSPGKNTGVRCHPLLQGIFLTQGSNSCLL